MSSDNCLKIQTGVKCIAMEILYKNGPKNSKPALNVRATNVWKKFKRALNVQATNVWKFKGALNVRRQMSKIQTGVKCPGDKCLKIQWALNVRATNVWKSKWALNVRRQMSENSHWRQMSLGVKCHMPISRQMSLASIVTTSNRHQRSGLKSLGDKRPRRQTAWILLFHFNWGKFRFAIFWT